MIHMPDKYTAVWISHTSLSDFLVCPRAYYLKHVYRHPATRHKIKMMSPQLALGQCVHEVLEGLSQLPKGTRFVEPLMVKFDQAWEKVSGKKGGFFDPDMEYKYKTRGGDMLRRVMRSPGPLSELSVKIQKDLPYFWISEEDNIILCGKIDWLEYLPDTDSIHIIDFKTGRGEEDPNSLQLPVYYLLVQQCQIRPVTKASYWYLDRDDVCSEQALPNAEESMVKILALGREVKLARQLDRFKCRETDGCRACSPLETIVRGEAELVGTDGFNYDIFVLPVLQEVETRESVIL